MEKFLAEKTSEVKKAGFSVRLRDSILIKTDGGACSGFFDAQGKSLEVATKRFKSVWFPVFVHEYCHFRQWRDNCKIWRDSDKMGDEINLWEWLDHDKEYSAKELQSVKKITQKLEQDCDKRAVEQIKEHHLPIDIDSYIRGSNAYVLFYNICVEDRKWYKYPPYANRSVKEMMPRKFISESEYGKTPVEYRKLVRDKFLD